MRYSQIAQRYNCNDLITRKVKGLKSCLQSKSGSLPSSFPAAYLLKSQYTLSISPPLQTNLPAYPPKLFCAACGGKLVDPHRQLHAHALPSLHCPLPGTIEGAGCGCCCPCPWGCWPCGCTAAGAGVGPVMPAAVSAPLPPCEMADALNALNVVPLCGALIANTMPLPQCVSCAQ